jgi:hypothetical protein
MATLAPGSWKDRAGYGAPGKQMGANVSPRVGLPSTGVPVAGQMMQLKATTPTVGPAAQVKWDYLVKWMAIIGGVWFLLQLSR